MRTKFTGLGTAIVTPFTKRGEGDEKAVHRLGRRQRDSGTHLRRRALWAVGGRRVISVVSNQIPKEMSQMVELADRNDFAAARAIHNRIIGLMQINFVEGNPGPVKYAMAAMGLIEDVF